MKQIQYKGVKYSVPTSWEEVPISKLIELNDDEQTFKTGSTKKLAFISAFVGIPVEVIRKSKVQEVSKLFKYLGFIAEDLPSDPIYEFEFRGDTYSVKESLVEQEFQDFVSMETVLADNEGHMYKALPTMLAIMCKKEGESLDDYDVGARAKMFLDLPVTIAHPLSVFFYAQEKVSKMLSLVSSRQELVIQMKRKEVLDTLKKQGGTAWLIRLQTGLLRSLIKFTIPKQTKSYTSIPPS